MMNSKESGITNVNQIFNITNYCEDKVSYHEQENDPDLNYFNNITQPTSEYYDLAEIENYFNNLNFKIPLNLVHINCRSMGNKLNEIKAIANLLKANIIAVSETWMSQEIASITSMEAYNFEHKARINNQKGGGVGIFIDKALKL